MYMVVILNIIYSYLKYNAGNLLINLKINHWQNKKPLFMSSTLLVSMLAPTHKAFCDKQENFATLIKIKLHVIGECFMFNFIIRLILFLLATVCHNTSMSMAMSSFSLNKTFCSRFSAF